MRALIVRAGTYNDENRQRIIRLINEIWKMVSIPEGVVIITKEMSPKWLGALRGMFAGNYFRYWASWKEFEHTPADWLVILDIDVLPLVRDAPAKLTNFLFSLPNDVGMVTRQPIGCVEDIVKENYFNPSEGVLAIRKDYVPALILSQIHYHFPIAHKKIKKSVCDYVLVNEGLLTSHLPPAKIAYFPTNVCIITSPAEAQLNVSTALLHPSGDITHPNFVDCVLTLLREYMQGVR